MPRHRQLKLNEDRIGLTARTRVLVLVFLVSSSLVIIFIVIYVLYHAYSSFIRRGVAISPQSVASLNLQTFTYGELKSATNNFDDANIIGRGGSGTVFVGISREGKLRAIKRLDDTSLNSQKEFENELQILGNLKTPFLITLLGYCCTEKKNRFLVHEYMPNRSLQESLFGEQNPCLSWERRFNVILDVARGLEFLHTACHPPVIHGDIKPSNVLLDFDFRAKISDFGLARFKESELDKSQELCGNSIAESSHRNDRRLSNGKVSRLQNPWDNHDDDDDDDDELFCLENEHSKELNSPAMDDSPSYDWWWRQNTNAESCSRDHVIEWMGNQITHQAKDSSNFSPSLELNDENSNLGSNQVQSNKKHHEKAKKKKRKMQEWWKEEHMDEMKRKEKKRKNQEHLHHHQQSPTNTEISFGKGWNKKKKKNISSTVSDRWSRDLHSHELSSTTSMRGTLCYIAPENGSHGCSMEKADIYSFGVLILVVVSGRRPLHVVDLPMSLEKANLVSWCKHLAQTKDTLELVDQRLKNDYDEEQAGLCINLALICLQKIPESRPDIAEIVRILKGEMDHPIVPLEFSPSPPYISFSG